MEKYIHVRSQKIEELECTFSEFVHVQSGASIIAIEADDPENFFCIHFQTVPYSSNGVAHVLEHTVLSGSEKYPVKDAFFSMLKRSLNTYMNALTGADFTCYPAATMNEKDFYNLLEVYIDSVFHPLLKKESFAQEGIRCEFSEEENSASPLVYKGVVFNEMKGSLSSPTTRFFEEMSKALFPTTPYGFNSGGDPKEIPHLTHKELLSFHEKYYDPSRALFFFYGNLPIAKHLNFLDEKILSKAKQKPKLEKIPHEKRFTHKKNIVQFYPSSEESSGEKTLIGFGFLTCPCTDSVEVFALNILDTYLMGSDAAPLKRALLSSKLCTQVSASLDTESLDSSYTLLLKGCDKKDTDVLENVLITTLNEIAAKPIDMAKVESTLHLFEFDRLEIGQEGGPFGLTLFARTALSRAHGKDPIEGLTIYKELEELRKNLAEDPYFLQKKIRKYFIENTHSVRLTMVPDLELNLKEQKEEEKALKTLQETLSEKDKEEVLRQTHLLKKYQEEDSEETYSCLPKILISDISKKSFLYELERKKNGNLDLFFHRTFTNHIVYADLVFPLGYIPEDDFWLLSLFCHFAPQVGCATRSFCENLEYIQAHTGGVGVQCALYPQTHSRTAFIPHVLVRGKALSRKKEHLFSLFYDMVTGVSFHEKERLEELVQKHLTNIESSLKSSPLRYAILSSSQHLSPLDTVQESCFGMHYVKKIRALAQMPNYSKYLQEELERLKGTLFSGNSLECVITCQEEDFIQAEENGFEGLSELSFKAHSPWKNPSLLPQTQPTIFETSAPIAFSAQAFEGVSFIDPKSASISLISNLLENVCLHKSIREQGGAYGGGASYKASTGHFYLYSFRDPHIMNTKENFEKAFNTISEGAFSEEDLEEAKLEVIQALDSPVPPGSRGDAAYTYYKKGKTEEIRNQFRSAMLHTSKEAIIDTCKNVLYPNFAKSSFVTFAGKELIKKEGLEKSPMFVTEKV